MRRWFIGIAVVSLLSLLAVLPAFALTATPSQSTPTPVLDIQTPTPIEYFTLNVLNTYPHDTGSYTQGLLLYDGTFYESAGETNESDLRQVDPETGKVLRQVDLDPSDFAEGLALVDDRLIQITWSQQIAYVYDRNSFERVGTFDYTGEGWGLCYDGEVLWMSDGSQILTARDPQTFEPVRELTVTYEGFPINQVNTQDKRLLSELNELECVDGNVYANVWFTDYILRISTTTGEVTGVIDASGLLTSEEQAELTNSNSVLNGIAYNPDSETFYLTGKYWPKLFEVEFQVVDTTGS